MKRYPTTPQSVVDAIHVVAEYLRQIEAAEAVIAPSGGASFHTERHADRILGGWDEERTSLRAQLDDAHQHVGALVGELGAAIAWIEERGQPSEVYAPTAAQILPQLESALRFARAWLRREAK